MTDPATSPAAAAPRLGHPVQTTPAADVVDLVALEMLGPTSAIPPLTDPPAGPVIRAEDDPMVALQHPRIIHLHSYHAAGWKHAHTRTEVRAQVSERLVTIADELPDGWGLATFDLWRSIELQQELFDALQADPDAPPGLIAEPEREPTEPPPHATGGAVDLTLTWQGTPLGLGTGFDDITETAQMRALEGQPGVERELRRHLYHRMRAEGFVVYPHEWWHWEWGTRRWASITGAAPIYGPVVL